jgi:hypothetical protein
VAWFRDPQGSFYRGRGGHYRGGRREEAVPSMVAGTRADGASGKGNDVSFKWERGSVVAHLPAVKVAGGLHGVDSAEMSGGGGFVAVRPKEEKRGASWLSRKGEVAQEGRGKGAGQPGGEGGQASAGLGQSKRLKPCWADAENKKK